MTNAMSTPVSFVDEFGYRWEFSAPVDPDADVFGLGPGTHEQVRQDRKPSRQPRPSHEQKLFDKAQTGDQPRRLYLSPDHGRHVKAGIANAKRLAAMRGQPSWKRVALNLTPEARAKGTERSAKVRLDNSLLHALDVLAQVEDIADETTSLRQIAQTLTERRIPAPAGGRHWHPEMVRRVRVRLADLERAHAGILKRAAKSRQEARA